MNRFILFLTISLYSTALFSQEGSIKGKVIDAASKQPLPGAVIQIKETSLNTISDTNGIYLIPNVPEGNRSVIIQMIGFNEKTVNDILVVRGKTFYHETELQDEIINSEEVTVTGYKYENDPASPVSTYGFSREEIFRNPGAQGDIFRAIGMLPGVSSSGGQYSAIAVRGQGTRDNVYMVDDIPMLDLSHLEGNSSGFQDPNGGRFSIFGPKVINEAKFQGGGFSTLYGRKSSAFLGLAIKEGNRESITVDGQLDLLGITLNYDGPSYFHKKTGVFLSVRHQDFTLLTNMINRKDIGKAAYSDIVLKTTSDLNKNNKLSFILSLNPEKFSRGEENVKADKSLIYQNFAPYGGVNKGVAGINLRTLINSRSYIKNVAYFRLSNSAFTVDRAHVGITEAGELDPLSPVFMEKDFRKINYNESELGYRSIYTYIFSNKSSLTAGVDLQQVGYSIYRKVSRTDTSYSFTSGDIASNPSQKYIIIPPHHFNNDKGASSQNVSAYAEYTFEPVKRLTVNASARYDYTGFIGTNTIAPRASVNYQANEKNSISLAGGVYYQDPIYFLLADQPQDKGLLNERVIQVIGGYKHHFSPDLKFTAEPWYKLMDNLVVQPQTGARFLTNDGSGYAYGTDFNLTKRLTKKYHGQVGYSFMTSRRNNNDRTGEYDYSFSQPNQFNVLLSYQANKKWILSSKFRYATGRPKDRYEVHYNVLKDASKIRYSRELVAKGADRLPDFISLDIRADYRVQLSRFAFSTFVDIVNVFDRFNINSVNFNEFNGKAVNDGVAIFPTFGLRFDY